MNVSITIIQQFCNVKYFSDLVCCGSEHAVSPLRGF